MSAHNTISHKCFKLLPFKISVLLSGVDQSIGFQLNILGAVVSLTAIHLGTKHYTAKHNTTADYILNRGHCYYGMWCAWVTFKDIPPLQSFSYAISRKPVTFINGDNDFTVTSLYTRCVIITGTRNFQGQNLVNIRFICTRMSGDEIMLCEVLPELCTICTALTM